MLGNKKLGAECDSLIAKKTTVRGDIHFRGSLHIDGKIEGSILAEDETDAIVRVSNRGHVSGEIRAPHVIINGDVTGNIHASKRIELSKHAHVKGDVHYTLIEMISGARISGKLHCHNELPDTAKKEKSSKKYTQIKASTKTMELNI